MFKRNLFYFKPNSLYYYVELFREGDQGARGSRVVTARRSLVSPPTSPVVPQQCMIVLGSSEWALRMFDCHAKAQVIELGICVMFFLSRSNAQACFASVRPN